MDREQAAQSADELDIAIIGMAGRFPGANDVDAFWQNCRNGVESIRDLSEQELLASGASKADLSDPAYVRRASTLDGVDQFDPLFFGYSPKEAAAMDPQARVFLETAWHAIEDAGYDPHRYSEPVGVFAAGSLSTYLLRNVHGHMDHEQFTLSGQNIGTVIGNGADFLATRVSFKLNLTGPALDVQTACSSSLVAVHLARQSLLADECSMALAGGVSIYLPQEVGYRYEDGLVLSPDGHCRVFDADAAGTVFGRGAGCVVLKRLPQAIRDGDRILAVIKGSAINNDGSDKVGFTAPSVNGQAAVIAEAIGAAGVEPESISYVEAHGTGTAQGDPIEIAGLKKAFRDSAGGRCALGSVKANIGHLDAASGIVGLIKLVQMLRHREIPPVVNFRRLHPAINLDGTPFYVSDRLQPWQPNGDRLRAGISAFGMGGTNAHAILEEAPDFDDIAERRACDVLFVSAKSRASLRRQVAAYADALTRNDAVFADLCATSRMGRARFGERLAVTGKDGLGIAAALQQYVAEGSAPQVLSGHVADSTRPRIAFLFTGQGAQYAGMGAALYRSQPVFRATLDRCDAILRPLIGRSIIDIMHTSDNQGGELDQTQFTQPALFAYELAMAELLRSWGIEPAVVLGHSVGEYAAATFAGALSLEDGLALIAERGRLIQALPEGGSMAAVFAPEEMVRDAIAGSGLSIAAVNAPLNTVISGASDAVTAAASVLDARGISSRPLNVSHAFHSALMDPILDAFERRASALHWREPSIPLVANVTGSVATFEQISDPAYWRRHLREPVRFEASVRRILNEGISCFLEVGPHPVLSALVSECSGDAEVHTVAAARRTGSADEVLMGAVGELFTVGAPVGDGFESAGPIHRAELPKYSFDRMRCWVEPTQSKPRRGEQDGHPLLGTRLRSPLPDAQFESFLDASELGYLRDHEVFGHVVYPATAHVEMAMAATVQLYGDTAFELRDVALQSVLLLDEARAAQIVVSPRSGDSAEFKIYAESDAGGESWGLHSTGRIVWGPEAPGSVADRPWLDPTLSEWSSEQFYQLASQHGLNYGPAFRGVEQVRRRDGLAWGRISAPASVWAERTAYHWHPALLDAGLQVVLATVLAPESASYLPVNLGRVRMYSELPQTFLARAEIEQDDAGIAGRRARLQLVAESGAIIGEIEGIRLQQVSGLQTDHGSIEDAFSVLTWEVQALTPGPASKSGVSPLPTALELGQAASGGFEALRTAHGLDVYDALEPRLDELCLHYMVNALLELGWDYEVSQRLHEDEIAAHLNVVVSHRAMLRHTLHTLATEGFLASDGENWLVNRRLEALPLADTAQDLLREFPTASAELTMTIRCGENLGAVLRGAQDPLQLLFPDGSVDDLERLYSGSPFARVYNALVRDAVKTAVRSLPPEQNLRILEIGAGTGGTATWVLPELPADRTNYQYTDLSHLFTMRARERFAQYPFISYGLLDIDQDPMTQGYEPQSFDIILATNVLHATVDLEATVRRARSLLAPGGLLVVVEGLGRQPWVDLIFGLTQGWWRANDPWRPDGHPLLPISRWQLLLEKVGFKEFVSIPSAQSPNALFHQAVFLATAPTTIEKPAEKNASDEAWLLFADQSGLSEDLQTRLELGGQSVLRIEKGDAFRRVAPKTFTIDPVQPGHFSYVVASVGAEGLRLKGVVMLWPLDDALDDEASSTELLTHQAGGSSAVLYATQALLETNLDQSFDGVWVVTRGGQSVIEASRGPDVTPRSAGEHATLWGLGRVIRAEIPELLCRNLDLDPDVEVTDESIIETLAVEILASADEDQVAWRSGQRWVARVEAKERALEAPGTRLEIPERGSFDQLTWSPVQSTEPGPGQVEIRVEATGLIFKDVLNVLGSYPGDSGLLGAEVAGVVSRVGEGVRNVTVGDSVIAITKGGFASSIVADAALVARYPAFLSAEAAATIPVAFLTAYDALVRYGGIKAGQTVLIHSGAGGVGMAAIQLAQRAGAEVYATAGSAAKRARLRAMGVKNVLGSRDLRFRDDILRLTNGTGVDLILNSLAGEFVAASVDVLARGGIFLEIGKTDVWSQEEFNQKRPDASYHLIDFGSEIDDDPSLGQQMLSELMPAFESGALRPLPWYRFEAAHVKDAFRHMAASRHIGKIVIAPPRDRSVDLAAVLPGGTWLITGGFGGLGLLLAEWLSDNGVREIVLLGRRVPHAEAMGRIEELRSRQVRVHTAQVDVSDQAAVTSLITSIGESMPPLVGVIHGAGTLDDGLIEQQNAERFATVLHAKMEGAWNLHKATIDSPLRAFVMFSSVASMLGTRGQANHAAANAYMDRLAGLRRAAGLPGLSIQWGAWSGVGAASGQDVQRRLEAQGFLPISPTQGLAAFEKLLRQAASDPDPATAVVAVAPMRWAQYIESLAGSHRPSQLQKLATQAVQPKDTATNEQAAESVTQALKRADAGDRRQILRDALARHIGASLGLDARFAIDPSKPLVELGLDSLLAVEMRSRIGKLLGLDRALPATVLFDYPTLATLVDYLLEDVLSFESIAVDAPAPPKVVSKPTENADDLSDITAEEAEALLLFELSQLRNN